MYNLINPPQVGGDVITDNLLKSTLCLTPVSALVKMSANYESVEMCLSAINPC